MFKVIKKNQIVIFAIALMLITVGYLNHTIKTEQMESTLSKQEKEEIASWGDARLVSTYSEEFEDEVVNQDSSKVNEIDENIQVSDCEDVEEVNSSEYFEESRMEREKMYSEMLESYQLALSNNTISAEERSRAQVEISKINQQKNAIMISENLIKNKGFNDIVIFVNNESVSVVVDAENLEQSDIAQIQSIIEREIDVKTENIHISVRKSTI